MFSARPWFNNDRRGPAQSSSWSGTKLSVWFVALPIYKSFLNTCTESFVPNHGELRSEPQRALFRTTESFVPNHGELCPGSWRALFGPRRSFLNHERAEKNRFCRALINATGSFVQTTESFFQITGNFVQTTEQSLIVKKKGVGWPPDTQICLFLGGGQ